VYLTDVYELDAMLSKSEQKVNLLPWQRRDYVNNYVQEMDGLITSISVNEEHELLKYTAKLESFLEGELSLDEADEETVRLEVIDFLQKKVANIKERMREDESEVKKVDAIEKFSNILNYSNVENTSELSEAILYLCNHVMEENVSEHAVERFIEMAKDFVKIHCQREKSVTVCLSSFLKHIETIELDDDVKAITHCLLSSILMYPIESVVESMCSILAVHSTQVRGISHDKMDKEVFLHINGPPINRADNILKKSLDRFFSKNKGISSKWHFLAPYSKFLGNSCVLSRKLSEKTNLPFLV
jgi:hypothetical protein